MSQYRKSNIKNKSSINIFTKNLINISILLIWFIILLIVTTMKENTNCGQIVVKPFSELLKPLVFLTF